MKKMISTMAVLSLLLGGCAQTTSSNEKDKKTVELLNVSYDPTRELYTEYNKVFADYWKKEEGQNVKITQSHGGSGKQGRAIIDGLRADVATLALAYDIDELAKRNLLDRDWEKNYSNFSSPYTSTIVFVVRKGNPKGIKDWNDLVKKGVSVITPNPKTSGGARWNYLAAWAYAKDQYKDDKEVKNFVKKIYKNVEVLDSGARGSTTTFAERKIGDVLVSWENEAYLVKKEFPNEYEIVNPSLSISAEPPVAVVNKNTKKNGTEEVAKAYLERLYTKEAQEIIAKNFYRPVDSEVAEKYKAQFPTIKLVNIRDAFGGWEQAQKEHFSDGGIFDQIYQQ